MDPPVVGRLNRDESITAVGVADRLSPIGLWSAHPSSLSPAARAVRTALQTQGCARAIPDSRPCSPAGDVLAPSRASVPRQSLDPPAHVACVTPSAKSQATPPM